jgi:integrase
MKTWDKLISNATEYLRDVLVYKPSSIKVYNHVWQRVKLFMDGNIITDYDKKIEGRFIEKEFNGRGLEKLGRWEKRKYYIVRALTQFLETDEISYVHREKVTWNLDGEIGQSMQAFIQSEYNEKYFSLGHRHRLEKILCGFLEFCKKSGVERPSEMTAYTVIKYFIKGKVSDYLVPSVLRRFFDYLFRVKILASNYSSRVPKLKRVIQPKLPPEYSKEEVKKLITSIDRSSNAGKRDYAIVLLASLAGMRIGDITNLKFGDLNWDAEEIMFNQLKTGVPTRLPLLTQVGNAIIDYVQYARPKSIEPHIFLRSRTPHLPFESGLSTASLVRRVFEKSGVSIKGRKYGPHALRHSFSQRMADEGVSMEVNSAALGHVSLESTNDYIRKNRKAMMQCVIEVKNGDERFYKQKGRRFYA